MTKVLGAPAMVDVARFLALTTLTRREDGTGSRLRWIRPSIRTCTLESTRAGCMHTHHTMATTSHRSWRLLDGSDDSAGLEMQWGGGVSIWGGSNNLKTTA